MDRRHFLLSTGAIALATATPRALAQSGSAGAGPDDASVVAARDARSF